MCSSFLWILFFFWGGTVNFFSICVKVELILNGLITACIRNCAIRNLPTLEVLQTKTKIKTKTCRTFYLLKIKITSTIEQGFFLCTMFLSAFVSNSSQVGLRQIMQQVGSHTRFINATDSFSFRRVRDITWMSEWFVHLTKCSMTLM